MTKRTSWPRRPVDEQAEPGRGREGIGLPGTVRRTRWNHRGLRVMGLVIGVSIVGLVACQADQAPVPPEPDFIVPDANLKVAIIGDSGYGPRADAVLAMIRDQGAQLVLHQGDLGYDEANPESPVLWHAGVERMLDTSVEGLFPYLYSVGNHDVKFWDQVEPKGYGRILRERTAQTDGLECNGELGVNATCTYQGLFVVLSGAGTMGEGHTAFMASALDDNQDYLWRITSWHKNQHDMQAGGKGDETGWEVYQESQRGGAIIVTGHEHSYSRSYTLTDLGNQATGYGATGDARRMELAEGKTFVVVNGLGGKSGRDYDCAPHDDDTWWASVFARNYWLRNGNVMEKNCSAQEADGEVPPNLEPRLQFTQTVEEYADGALFITFHVDGDPHRARGEFVTVDGHQIDDFEIVNLRTQ